MSSIADIIPIDKVTNAKEFLTDSLNKLIGDDATTFIQDHSKIILMTTSSIFGMYYIISKIRERNKRDKLPGPSQWPIVGSFFKDNHLPLHQRFDKWAKIYGADKGLYAVNLLSTECIVVSSLEGLQECLLEKSLEFSGRIESYRMQLASGVPNDIIFTSYSPEWHARKKLAMKSMKMHGDGLEKLESVTSEILDDFFKHLDSKHNSSWTVNEDLICCFVNIIFALALGKRFPWGDPVISLLKNDFDESQVAQVSTKGYVIDQYPFLWKLKIPRDVCKGLQTGIDCTNWFEKEISSVLETFTPNQPRGYADLFYQEYLAEKKAGNTSFTYEQVILMTMQTLLAGYATTATAVTCLLQFLVKNPDIQQKMYEEVIKNVGKDKRPGLEDKQNHPYIQASILELLRLISHIPFSVHCALRDTTLCGYRIPKNVRIITNFWTLHHDEKIFPEPYSFKPERYLDDEGKVVPPGHPCRKALFPFGAGRRVCLGETLAKNRLFLVVAAMVQRYEFLPVNPEKAKKVDPRNYDFGIVLNPGDVTVKINKRK